MLKRHLPKYGGRLNGVQLWVALPEVKLNIVPAFIHADDVPVIKIYGNFINIFTGSLQDISCPLPYYTDSLGLEVRVHEKENL